MKTALTLKEHREKQAASKIGQIINDHEVLEHAGYKAEPSGKRNSIYKVKCKCGNITVTSLKNVKRIKGCACTIKERTSKPKGSRLPYGEASFNEVYISYKGRAKYTNKDFTLTKQEFKDITSKDCTYCGIEPLQQLGTSRVTKEDGLYLYNGIDRVDSSIGYIEDNCVPCCGICNKAKRDLALEDFKSWINRLIKFNEDGA